MVTDSLTQFLSRRRPQLWGAIFGALGGAAFAGAITSLLPGAAFLWLGAPVATFGAAVQAPGMQETPA